MAASQPKVNVEIPEELHTKLSELLPHGTRKRVVNIMLEDLVRLLESSDKELALGAILSRKLQYEDFSSADLPKHGPDKQPSNEHNGDGRGPESRQDHREAEQTEG